MAIVRKRKETEGQTPALHLEFIDNEFQVERIRAARLEAAPVKIQLDEREPEAFSQAWPETVEVETY